MISIQAEKINKSFKAVKALQDISFKVNENELFGFIGPDGAGKTTLFRILNTLLIADSGRAIVDGKDVVKDYKEIRKHIGYMPGKFSLYQDLSVEENLTFFATIFGTTIKENYHLIAPIYSQIEPFKKRRAGALSGGMKQKLALSCALIHKPKVLVLDESTTGVDAVSRKEFWEMLKDLKQKGITIIVSTPYMDEASLCDKIALIQKGKILSIDTPDAITKQFNRNLFAVKASDKYRLISELENYEFAHSVYPFGQYIHYSDVRGVISEREIAQFLERKNHKNIEVRIIKANIEDLFMELMTKGE